MKYQDYKEIEEACEQFARATVTGCRQQRNKASLLTSNEIKKRASERTKNASYFVWCGTINHGTNNWPDLDYNGLDVVRISDCIETPKTFKDPDGRHYWLKSKIIGWLS